MKHIVIEAKCLYYFIEDTEKQIPSCCKYEPGRVGTLCFKFNEEKHKYCPYLGIGTAKASLVLTDGEGEAINADGYWGDFKMSEEDWIKEEKKWIEKQNRYISEQSDESL
ncbi:hypothetical protein R9X47_22675 [Wukongibacter baidiensis]|uniref:hypothetical protein n=1 Tax=Wukongibacter baidiensis TaxID=1723361 RepID=UPI003D7F93D4